METDTHKLWTQKDGRETRYFLLTQKQIDRELARQAANAAKLAVAS
jgi:hypothetical protein